MDRRHHDVTWRFVAKLHDPLAQIRINDLDPFCLEMRIETAFLGQHRFAFDDPPNVLVTQERANDFIMFIRVARPMDGGTGALGVRLEFEPELG